MTAVLTDRPDHVIADVPMSEAAAAYITADNAADIVAAYFTPQVTSPKRGSDGVWHIYNDIALTVVPGGRVVWCGPREYPEEQADDGLDPISGRRMRLAAADTTPAGFRRSRNGGGKRSGHKGGHRHPTRVENLLERCEAAGLVVEELPGKGKHWKISRPADWPVPPRATSGCVFVSSTTEFRAIAKNTAKIARETGVDVRDIDPAEMRRAARRVADPTTTSEDPEMTATLDEAPPTPEPTSEPTARPVPARPVAKHPATPEQVRDRLIFVAEMRPDHTDAEIAECMGVSANWLAAFLSVQRAKGHPDAVPPRKQYTEPNTGVVTRAGVMPRRKQYTGAVRSTVAQTATTAPAVYRQETHPVTEAEVTKLLGAVRNLGKISRTDIVKLFWRRKRRAELDALIQAAVDTGQVRVTTERRSNYGYATTYLEWVEPEAVEPESAPEPEAPEQLPETDQAVAEEVAALSPGVEITALFARDQVIAEGTAAIEQMVGEAAAPEPVEPELPEPAVEVEDEPAPGAVPDTVTEDAPENPAAEPEGEEFPDDPARMVDLADLTAYLEALDELAADAGSAPQDGPGAVNGAGPVSQTPEDASEALSGPPHYGQTARYATTCAVCAGEIAPGTEIVRARGRWQHVRHLDEPVTVVPTASSAMPSAVTVLEAALRRIGVAEPELVARNLRFELTDSGWRLRIEAAL